MLAVLTTGTVVLGPEVYTFAAAALVLAIGGIAITGLLLERGGRLPEPDVDFATWSGALAAGLSFGAAAIHFAVIGEHFAEYPPYGVAFTAFAWFQVGWGVRYVVRPERWLAALAIVVNVGALAVWVFSRFVGLPIGPDPGAIEAIGPLDLVSGVLELAMIGVLGWNLVAPRDRWRPGLAPPSAVAYVGSAVLAIVILTSAAFAVTGGTSHSAASDDSAVTHAHGSTAAPPETAAAAAPSTSTPAASPPVGSPRVASPPPSPAVERPGAIVFGSGFDLAGAIQGATTTFRPGQTAAWLAELSEPPDAPTVRFMIFQVLPDGRELEHWRQDVPVSDPGGRQIVGMADLSIYVHGGAGSYVMRYFRGDVLLAEGAFAFAL